MSKKIDLTLPQEYYLVSSPGSDNFIEELDMSKQSTF